jgi:hypothetical protein
MNYTSFLRCLIYGILSCHIETNAHFSPFLEVVKNESTDELVTARALAAIEKFINYGLMSPTRLYSTKFPSIYSH